jgi:hypothetical protein
MKKIIIAAVALAASASISFAAKAPLPNAGHKQAAEESVDYVQTAIDCLENEKSGPGLTQGSEEEARSGAAHFTVLTVGKERRIAFHAGLRQGNDEGVDTDKVDACMKDFGKR